MPPPLPTEYQLRRDEEELVQAAPAAGITTSPDDETEDEEPLAEEPVIGESSDAAKSPEVAAQAAARSLSLELKAPAQRKRKAAAPRKDPYLVSDDEPMRKRTRASTAAQGNEDDINGSPSPEKSPQQSSTEEKGNKDDEQPKTLSDDSTEKSAGEPKSDITEVSEDEIVVARPSSKSRKSTQPSSSAGLSSTPAPTPLRACPFLHTPNRTVLLSHLSPDGDMKKWLRKQGVTIKEDAKPKDNFLCVVEEKKGQGLESIPTTFKVMKTLLAKKLVVSESWMLESVEEDDLMDPSGYVVVDGRDCDRSSLYAGLTVFFTSKAVEGGFAKLKTLATQAGATRVESGKATKGLQLTPRTSVIFLAAKDDDPAGAALIIENCRVYERSLLTKSILRGELDLESDEFRLS